jgi:hypothetical protein
MPNPTQISNCEVLGDGSDPGDFAHISKTTPRKTKVKEVHGDLQYRTDLNAGFDVERQKATTKARREGSVRPLGGGISK